jgi:TolA-binding protein
MRPFVPRVIVAALLLAAFGASVPAFAQVESREGIVLQNQIYQLQQQLKAMQDRAGRGGGPQPAYPAPAPQYSGSGDLVAQLLTRVDALEDQVRQLRGRIDETQNQVQRQGADLGKRIDDQAFQAGNAAGTAAPASPRAAPPSVNYVPGGVSPSAPPTPPPPRAPGPRTPEIALQDGNAALGRRDYTAAEAAAREVLTNRTSPRAYDAQVLLAQALSGQRQYAQAAIAFDDAYNRSRKGSHAQDALVGLAGSLAAINEKKAACDTLTRLHTEFPQPRPDIRDSAAATAQKAGCH